MRTIKYLVVHCTATPQTTNVESIQRHWRERLGWKANGYHKIVKANGEVITLAQDDAVCNGVAGFNSVSLHVSYIGGIDSRGNPLDNRTQGQKDAISQVLHAWKQKYPSAIIQGHRDFLKRGVNWKECPSFNAKAEYSHI
jgi:N-acetylmuramoyl-L-alanine amidase